MFMKVFDERYDPAYHTWQKHGHVEHELALGE